MAPSAVLSTIDARSPGVELQRPRDAFPDEHSVLDPCRAELPAGREHEEGAEPRLACRARCPSPMIARSVASVREESREVEPAPLRRRSRVVRSTRRLISSGSVITYSIGLARTQREESALRDLQVAGSANGSAPRRAGRNVLHEPAAQDDPDRRRRRSPRASSPCASVAGEHSGPRGRSCRGSRLLVSMVLSVPGGARRRSLIREAFHAG